MMIGDDDGRGGEAERDGECDWVEVTLLILREGGISFT